eukprot:gene51472-62946_t
MTLGSVAGLLTQAIEDYNLALYKDTVLNSAQQSPKTDENTHVSADARSGRHPQSVESSSSPVHAGSSRASRRGQASARAAAWGVFGGEGLGERGVGAEGLGAGSEVDDSSPPPPPPPVTPAPSPSSPPAEQPSHTQADELHALGYAARK